MAKSKILHFAQFLVHGPTYHSHAMWRHPKTTWRYPNTALSHDGISDELSPGGDGADLTWNRPELYQHIAQVCERGLFDMVFFADLNYISDTYTGSLEPALRHAAQAPEHDPIPLLSFMAAVTNHVGLASTFSTSHHHPYYVARLWATLDHLTRGRAGWNVVTSLNHNQAANFGEEREPTDVRYEKAHEFIEVCQKLWNSWDDDAVVMDPASGTFVDGSKVHRIEHVGRFYRSRGPLNVVRSPFRGPAILQAGTSPKGLDFAARYADAIFAIQPRPQDAAEYFNAVKDLAVDHGRRPEECRVLFGAQPIIGTTEAEAREKQQEHNELVPIEAGMSILSAHLDFDLSTLDPNEAMADRTEPELQRMRTRYLKPDGSSFTVAEVAQRHGQSVGIPQFVGTAKSVADQLEAFAVEVGGDGFMLSPISCPGAIEEFVDNVIPVLQKRGLSRDHYVGSTVKDHLNQTT